MTLPTIDERNEILQNIIDRLLYLPDNERETFVATLESMFIIYSIDMHIEDGIRVYNTTKKISNGARHTAEVSIV